ncbi:hypothetical protein [Phaeocystidibacter luteus]|uniref:TfoX/Sxy family protein n=1 Tax=Phaeocystidibacter luteus TaxID=911197 RepID=A0A6N6REB7_9FLAO|nr:hypothetical protein [Phaeocystidibacter luteus]KAB2806787.1 hypothetical protein F8C67_13035 [Phaeocystidibacter luteus]
MDKELWQLNLARYDELVAQCVDFKRLGKTMPYTSTNGYMFSLLNKDAELGIRFSKDVQESYMQEFNTTYYRSYGAVMKGYILIPEALFSTPDRIVELLKESHAYVMSLEPK